MVGEHALQETPTCLSRRQGREQQRLLEREVPRLVLADEVGEQHRAGLGARIARPRQGHRDHEHVVVNA
jgi:hypothetical protein